MWVSNFEQSPFRKHSPQTSVIETYSVRWSLKTSATAPTIIDVPEKEKKISIFKGAFKNYDDKIFNIIDHPLPISYPGPVCDGISLLL